MTDTPRVQYIRYQADGAGLAVSIEVYRPGPFGRPMGATPRASDVPADIRAALADWLAGADT